MLIARSFSRILCGIVLVLLVAAPSGFAQTKIDTNCVKAANEGLRAAFESGEPSLEYMRSQLNVGDYAAVEGIYKSAMARYQKNIDYERFLLKGYDQFTPENDIALSSLNEWVQKTGSAIAHAARGIYKSQQASDARGTASAQNTPAARFQAMASYHAEAIEDLFMAQHLDPTIGPVYVHLIRIAMSQRGAMPMTKIEILNEALKNDPRSYYIRAQYMVSLKPRWGGSVTEMYTFAQRFAEDSDVNPRFNSFLGEINADNADLSFAKKDYKDAIMRYSFALKFGDRVDWLMARGKCHFQLGEFDEAKADFMDALGYDPSDEQALQWVLYTNGQLQSPGSKT